MNNQLTPNTCGLACFEAVLEDLGIVRSQADLLQQYKTDLLIGLENIGQFGAFNLFHANLIAPKLNLAFERWKDHDQANMAARFVHPKNQRGIIFGLTINGNRHMAKLESVNGTDVNVSEADFSQAQAQTKIYSFAQLVAYDFEDWHFIL